MKKQLASDEFKSVPGGSSVNKLFIEHLLFANNVSGTRNTEVNKTVSILVLEKFISSGVWEEWQVIHTETNK